MGKGKMSEEISPEKLKELLIKSDDIRQAITNDLRIFRLRSDIIALEPYDATFVMSFGLATAVAQFVFTELMENTMGEKKSLIDKICFLAKEKLTKVSIREIGRSHEVH